MRVIEVRGLRKSFRVGAEPLPVLAGVDLAAGRGEFVSLIGPSGCGKSTLFNVLVGLEPLDAGEVRLNGEAAPGKRELFAYMPQQDLLFPWRRVIDNITLGLEVQGMSRRRARERVRPLLPTFGLEGFEHAYPFELSGGMRQRAALLRTVVQERPVLLLDEPFGALDSLTRTTMQRWLEQLWERFRWTALLITHDVREAIFLSDRVYVLSPRPAHVRAWLEVPIPRPRALAVMATPPFLEIERQVRALLDQGAVGPRENDRDADEWEPVSAGDGPGEDARHG
ncbi:MAG: ATP-binding cassette domain-containing protein [Dehalococcoidia bacterium]|nr:ATP-binding cassette domain-containing protein [Dehalococcoidia bacterium]